MGRYYIDTKTGKSLNVNNNGTTFLTKITLGLWDKIGFSPKTKEDCKLITRICRNYLKYQEYIKESSTGTAKYFQEAYNLERLSEDDIEWLEEVTSFFEKAEGIKE